jgi:hypothetical protein
VPCLAVVEDDLSLAAFATHGKSRLEIWATRRPPTSQSPKGRHNFSPGRKSWVSDENRNRVLEGRHTPLARRCFADMHIRTP